MPVQETSDAIEALTGTRLPIGSVIVNMTSPPLLPARELTRAAAGRLDVARLGATLGKAGLDPALAAGLAAEATEHAVRHVHEQGYRDDVAALGRQVYELPMLAPPMDLGGLYDLAELLRDQGVA